jgi:SHS2 domain-containing protein
MPFRFREEIATADVAFDAWGSTKEELFTASADALLRTMTEDPEEVERRITLTISLEHAELDLLLLDLLNELVYIKDARKLLLHLDKVQIDDREGVYRLVARGAGEELDPYRHKLLVDVKAATLHRLRVAFEEGVWRATVVLDV